MSIAVFASVSDRSDIRYIKTRVQEPTYLVRKIGSGIGNLD